MRTPLKWTSLNGIILLLAVISLPVKGGELAALGVAAHESTLKQIKKYHANLEIRFNVKKRAEQDLTFADETAEYWRVDEESRMTLAQSRGRKLVDFLFRPDKTEVVVSLNEAQRPGAIGLRIEPRYRRVTELDAYELSLFTLPVGLTRAEPTPVYTLKEALQTGDLAEEKWVQVNGENQLFLNIKIEKQHRSYSI